MEAADFFDDDDGSATTASSSAKSASIPTGAKTPDFSGSTPPNSLNMDSYVQRPAVRAGDELVSSSPSTDNFGADLSAGILLERSGSFSRSESFGKGERVFRVFRFFLCEVFLKKSATTRMRIGLLSVVSSPILQSENHSLIKNGYYVRILQRLNAGNNLYCGHG